MVLLDLHSLLGVLLVCRFKSQLLVAKRGEAQGGVLLLKRLGVVNVEEN